MVLRAQRRMSELTYNQVRPHEALGQRTPAEIYRAAPTARRQPGFRYPAGWIIRRIRSNGQIKWNGKKRFIGEAFVGYPVALKPPRAGKSLVYFTNKSGKQIRAGCARLAIGGARGDDESSVARWVGWVARTAHSALAFTPLRLASLASAP